MVRPRHAARYRRPAPRVRVARWALLSVLAATFGWLTLVNELRVVGMGHIRTEESIVSTLFEGRIQTLAVSCNDRVAKGDRLAVVADAVRAHTYRGELLELEADHRARRAIHAARLATVEAAVAAAERQEDAARRHAANAESLAAATEQAWRTNSVPLKDRVAVLNARDHAREALAGAEATLRRQRAERERLRTEASAQLAGFEERVAAQRILAEFGGNEEIRAPFDGVVTECPRNVGDIVHPSVAIVRLQRTGSARIHVWVPAVELRRLREGMSAEVVVAEGGRRVSGKVLRMPLEVGALPDSLKRYFWQNQSWQQYAQIEIAPANPEDARDLPGDARIDAVIRLTEAWRLPIDLLSSL